MAQEWADYLVDEICLSNSGFTLDGLRLGENISSRWSNGNFEECGNFTQLIWASSREIGVGRAIRISGSDIPVNSGLTQGPENAVCSAKTVVVCFYFPPGNVTTMFCENVPPPMYEAGICESVLEPERR
ncbi:unnamed protein product [Schistocephalus solidus]|uniref:SCP domain-containing protein n=1 Tax=Schistocephalus solidus TaxID=70667 RepID=A0A183SJI2_SCHSO|nr:unnamed protein product [Schistocephalus solidus]